MAFELDTSGAVVVPDALMGEPRERASRWRWPDLSPFAQGYVTALFESAGVALLKPGRAGIFAGFSDLAPEALAAILVDCERMGAGAAGDALERDYGRVAWISRRDGHYAPEYLPQTPTLGDDGKVRLETGLSK